MDKNITAADKFTKELTRRADEDRRRIEEEMENYRSTRLRQAREKVEEEAELYKRKKIEKGTLESEAEISNLHLQERKKLVMRRSEITDEVISLSEKILVDFTQSPEYEDYLLRCAKKVSENLKSNKIVLYIAPKDEKFIPLIKESVGKYCRVEFDTDIKLGGIRGYDAILYKLVDETLDEKLVEQRRYFAQKSGLTISIR